MYSADGKKFLSATPDGYNAMQFLVDLSYKHEVQPPWGINQKGANTDNLWLTGKMGMYMTGSWNIPNSRDNEFEWNITSIPMKKEGHAQASLVCFGVPAKTKNPKESGFFAAALMDENAQKTWAETGFGIPVVKKYAEKYYIQPDEKPSRQTMVTEGLKYVYPPLFTIYTSRAKALWDATYKLTWSGEKTAKENMLAIKDEIELFLAGKK
jgi:multiple sugar transport system substrate-binding protein